MEMATSKDEITQTKLENKSETTPMSKLEVHKQGDAIQSLIKVQGISQFVLE
jgi:hypothetical protein